MFEKWERWGEIGGGGVKGMPGVDSPPTVHTKKKEDSTTAGSNRKPPDSKSDALSN